MFGIIEKNNGVLGIAGTAEVGRVVSTDATVLFVDKNHASADDNNDGTDPIAPKSTIQSAISSSFLEAGSVIFVKAGAYTETLTANATALVNDVRVVAVGRVTIAPATAGGVVLTLGKRWSFENVTFLLGTGVGVSLVKSATLDASYSRFERCTFNGQGDCTTGVDLNGAPSDVSFLHCVFHNVYNGSNNGIAIDSSSQATDETDRLLIDNCLFYDNDGNLDIPVNVSVIRRSVFNTAGNKDLTAGNGAIDLRGGAVGHNVVTGNLLGGDYSNTGGYYDNATGAGDWTGNYCADTAETEVGDNGITIAPPAA